MINFEMIIPLWLRSVNGVLNNSTEHGPSWETNSCTAGLNFSSISCNAKFHYRVHTTVQMIRIQSHTNP